MLLGTDEDAGNKGASLRTEQMEPPVVLVDFSRRGISFGLAASPASLPATEKARVRCRSEAGGWADAARGRQMDVPPVLWTHPPVGDSQKLCLVSLYRSCRSCDPHVSDALGLASHRHAVHGSVFWTGGEVIGSSSHKGVLSMEVRGAQNIQSQRVPRTHPELCDTWFGELVSPEVDAVALYGRLCKLLFRQIAGGFLVIGRSRSRINGSKCMVEKVLMIPCLQTSAWACDSGFFGVSRTDCLM